LETGSKFIRCPRCELNYINSEDKLCSVCKKEMDAAFSDEKDLDLDMAFDLDICPICKTNYINEDEVMCEACRKEQENDKKICEDEEDVGSSSDWNDDDEDADIETEEDGLGEMVNTIDVENDSATLAGLEDLDIGIPLDEDVDFSDELDEEENEEVEEEEYKDDFEDDFNFDDEDFGDEDDYDEDDEDDDYDEEDFDDEFDDELEDDYDDEDDEFEFDDKN